MQMGMVYAHFVWHWQHHIQKHVQNGWHINSKPNQFYNCNSLFMWFLLKIHQIMFLMQSVVRVTPTKWLWLYLCTFAVTLTTVLSQNRIDHVCGLWHYQTCVKLSLFLVCFHILSNHKILDRSKIDYGNVIT